MYKYEMDPTGTEEATEQTRDAGRTRDGRGTDGQTDGRTDGRKEWNQYTPPTTSLKYKGGLLSKYKGGLSKLGLTSLLQ